MNSIKENEVTERKEYLIKQLRLMGVYETTDGRKLGDVSIYTLEWNHILAKVEAARAYGE